MILKKVNIPYLIILTAVLIWFSLIMAAPFLAKRHAVTPSALIYLFFSNQGD